MSDLSEAAREIITRGAGDGKGLLPRDAVAIGHAFAAVAIAEACEGLREAVERFAEIFGAGPGEPGEDSAY